MKAKNCHIGKVVDINPLCSPNNSSYLLEIYHDFKIGESGEVCNNIGHFYIGLYDEESNQVTIKGKNPKTASIPLDFGDVKEESGRIKKSLEYEQTSSKTIFTAKSVRKLDKIIFTLQNNYATIERWKKFMI